MSNENWTNRADIVTGSKAQDMQQQFLALKRKIQQVEKKNAHQINEIHSNSFNKQKRSVSSLHFTPMVMCKQSFKQDAPYSPCNNLHRVAKKSSSSVITNYLMYPLINRSLLSQQHHHCPTTILQQLRNERQLNMKLQQTIKENKILLEHYEAYGRGQKMPKKQNLFDVLLSFQQQMSQMSLNYSQLICNNVNKYCKKNQNKLRNLQYKIRDKRQERKYNKVVGEVRRRSSSRKGKAEFQELVSEASCPFNSDSSEKMQAIRNSKQRDRKSNIYRQKSLNKLNRKDRKSSQNFELIAKNYEQLIKQKDVEIDQMEAKIKELKLENRMNKQQIERLKQRVEEYEDSSRSITVEKQEIRQNVDLRLLQKDQQIFTLNQQLSKLQENCHAAAQEISHYHSKMNRQQLKNEERAELAQTIKILQDYKNNYKNEREVMRENIKELENKLAQRSCEITALEAGKRKLLKDNQINLNKISELQKILTKNGENSFNLGEIVEKSLCVDTSAMYTELQRLREETQKLQLELQSKQGDFINQVHRRQQLELQLSREQFNTQQIRKQNQELVAKLQQERTTFQYKENNQADPKENQQLRRQVGELKDRYQTLAKRYKLQSSNNMELNSKVIQLQSQISFVKEQKDTVEERVAHLKDQIKQLKNEKNNILLINQQMRLEAENYRQKMRDLEAQINNNQQNQQAKKQKILNLLTEGKSSENQIKSIQDTQNMEQEQLQLKIKELEIVIQQQNKFEENIISEHRQNMEKFKKQIKDKDHTLEICQNQLQSLKTQLQTLSPLENQKNELSEDIEDTETENLKVENQRLHTTIDELFKQIQRNQEEIIRYQKELELMADQKNINETDKNLKVTQKGMLTSLNYSEIIADGNNSENSRIEAIEHFLNTSNYEMVHNLEQRSADRRNYSRVMNKVFDYIKMLKQRMAQKEHTISILTKKIHNLKKSQLVRKDIQVEGCEDFDPIFFKDYDSTDGDGIRRSIRGKVKKMESDVDLIVEENRLLNNRVNMLQEEILHSEEQENFMINVKDMYKKEIQDLLHKNSQLTQQYTKQVTKLRQALRQATDSSENMHNLHAIKQLYVKTVELAGLALEQKGVKREETKQQIGQLCKVFLNVGNYNQATRDKLLSKFIH